MRRLTIAMAALGSCLLTGCEDRDAVFVEQLAIVNINPSHGAVGIGYDTDITVTFSDVLDVSTVTSANMCLTADSAPPPDATSPCSTGTPVPATVTYDAQTASARLVPTDDLLPDERYTLHLTPALASPETGALAAPVSASFRTIPSA